MSGLTGGRALAVIDMLVDFADESGSLYCGHGVRRIIPAIKSQISQARALGTPIFFVCDRHEENDPEFQMFPVHCVKGTKGCEIISELLPSQEDRIVPKRRYSAFYGTDFDLSLREMGIAELILTGVCTNICVLYTAADARMRGYAVTVVENAVASFDEGSHQAALREMRKTLGASVVTALPGQLG